MSVCGGLMLEKIDLDWLKTFVFFADSDGVEETAQKLGITQPAVTQHLKKLEAALAQDLFTKQGKRKILTDYGRELHKSASLHLRNLDDVLRSSRFEQSAERNVTLRLGIHKEIYYRICDKINFDGQLEVHTLRTDEALQKLLKRELDIAIGRYAPDSSEIISVKWFSDSFIVIYPKSWADEIESKGLRETLKKKNFMYNLEGEQAALEALHSIDLSVDELRVTHKVSDWFSFFKLVRTGHAWGFAPSSFDLSPGISSTNISTRALPKTQFFILYNRTIRNYPGFQKFLASIKEAMK